MAREDEKSELSGRAGILIMRGMKPVIPVGGFRLAVNEDGSLAGGLALHLAMDMTPHWIRIAADSLRACENASAELRRVWHDGSRSEETEALEREFRASMQACAAAAFAVDAFYASVQDAAPVDPETKAAWVRNKTARHKQISELIRLRFKLPEGKFRELAAAMRSLFEVRDEAVHPKAGPQEVVHHPTIGVSVERRIGMFNANVAKQVVQTALHVVAGMAERPKVENKELVSYCSTLLADIKPITEEWLEEWKPDRGATQQSTDG